MTTLLMDACGDIDITNGKTSIVRGADAVKQRWLVYIRTFLGEWFLNLGIGVPYTQVVLSKTITVPVLKQVFTDASLEVPGVLQVTSVVVENLDVATRTADIAVNVVVDGDEGPETGQFKYTGTIPPTCGQTSNMVQDGANMVEGNRRMVQS